MNLNLSGLSNQEVEERRMRGEGGNAPASVTKSRARIIRENVCTLFNLLNFIIAGFLLAVGAYTNMIFLAIILLNIGIGIAQELKAKKLVDELSILNRPTVSVRREGKTVRLEMKDLVKDDLMVLESGDQITNDSVVVEGSMEVNESLLTGESDGVIKEAGSELFSGSSVISGKAYARVVCVGGENYASRLVDEVKKEKQVQSELLGSMKRVTKFTSLLIVPLGILLFVQALYFRDSALRDAVVSSAAALLGMLPKGLVLLISVSLANGVIKLAKMKILVQNIYALETLAHVDVLCLDKTGTITDGNMRVCDVIPLGGRRREELEGLVSAYLAASDDKNATFLALKEEFSAIEGERAVHKIPFSSKRKWGAVGFANGETVFVGAPERLLSTVPPAVDQAMEQGRRVIVIGRCARIWQDESRLPEALEPMYIVVLEDNIRPNTRETLEYFRKEGVDVKIISGDHVKTVSMIAKKAGLARYMDAVDLSAVRGEIDFDQVCRDYAVFARVTPKQKKELVSALKRQGHHVAMTGDGVNDLLALREADCSIGIADGSDASRQISQIVLLDSDFTNLPQVLLEGRRVINHVTRTAGVFFIKTLYSMLVSLFCLLANVPFPFIPIQITLIDACIEAYPSFLTIFESNTKKIRGKFLNTVLLNALPYAFIVTGMIAAITLAAPFSPEEDQTVMYLLLILMSMAAVVKSCVPFTKLRVFLCVTMAVGIFAALALFLPLFEITPVTGAMFGFLAAAFAGMLVILALLLGAGAFVKRGEISGRKNA